MDDPRLDIRKSTPNIGAEVFGLDLSQPLSDQQFQAVHDSLMDNLVLFFRDQKLNVEQHKAFGSRFGKLHVHPAAPGLIPNHPEIFVIKADEKSTQSGCTSLKSISASACLSRVSSVLFPVLQSCDGHDESLLRR